MYFCKGSERFFCHLLPKESQSSSIIQLENRFKISLGINQTCLLLCLRTCRWPAAPCEKQPESDTSTQLGRFMLIVGVKWSWDVCRAPSHPSIRVSSRFLPKQLACSNRWLSAGVSSCFSKGGGGPNAKYSSREPRPPRHPPIASWKRMSRGSISTHLPAPNPRNPSHPTHATTQLIPPKSLHLAHVPLRILPRTTCSNLPLLSFRSPTLGTQVSTCCEQ